MITLVECQGTFILDDLGEAVDDTLVGWCLLTLGLQTHLDNLEGLHHENLRHT